jgi:hypothetical protein
MNKERIALAAMLVAALSGCGNGKSSTGGSPQPSAAAAAATPNCNGQAPVWALARVKVYLRPGDRHYGTTKHGEYMCLSDARAEGYRPARGPRRQSSQEGSSQ